MTDEAQLRLVSVGARLRRAREANGLNLHDLALLSGFSAPALSLIETGKRDLRLTSLLRLAAALRLKASDLLDDLDGDQAVTSQGGGEGYDLADYL